jgi:hypothetical protein
MKKMESAAAVLSEKNASMKDDGVGNRKEGRYFMRMSFVITHTLHFVLHSELISARTVSNQHGHERLQGKR